MPRAKSSVDSSRGVLISSKPARENAYGQEPPLHAIAGSDAATNRPYREDFAAGTRNEEEDSVLWNIKGGNHKHEIPKDQSGNERVTTNKKM